MIGRRFPIGNAFSYTVTKDYSNLCVDDIKIGSKETKH